MKRHYRFGSGAFLIMYCLQAPCVIAQCSSTAAHATVFASESNFAFLNPQFAGQSNNNYAVAAAVATLFSGNTEYLRATGFQFAIPASASICGIRINLEKSATGISILAWVTDRSVRLVKGGNVVGQNRAKAAVWSGTDEVNVYGSSSDMWGTTLTPADINSPDFGIAVSAEITGLISLFPAARIDQVQVTVFYNVTLAVHLADFEVKDVDGSPELRWEFSGDAENETITLQRSPDQQMWNDVFTQSADELDESRRALFVDTDADGINYYRLRIQRNENVFYSPVRRFDAVAKRISLYPNPASDWIYIKGISPTPDLRLYNVAGIPQPVRFQRSATSYQVNISGLASGYYYISVGGKVYGIWKK